MFVQPYLFFDGRCEEALDFYKKALGAKVEVMMRFKDSPEPPRPDCPAPAGDKIMHASMRIGDTQVMASDGMSVGKPEFKGVSLSLTVKTDAEAEKIFKALSEGGQTQMPMAETFFARRFGMIADKFGVSWMVIHPKPMS